MLPSAFRRTIAGFWQLSLSVVPATRILPLTCNATALATSSGVPSSDWLKSASKLPFPFKHATMILVLSPTTTACPSACSAMARPSSLPAPRSRLTRPSGLPSAREAVSSVPSALKRWTMMLAPVAQPGVGQHLSKFLIIRHHPPPRKINRGLTTSTSRIGPPGRKMNECQAHRRACTELRERLQDGRAPSTATSAFMHEKFRKRHIANRAGPALSGSPRGAPSAARRGMAQAVPQEASEARSAQRRPRREGVRD